MSEEELHKRLERLNVPVIAAPMPNTAREANALSTALPKPRKPRQKAVIASQGQDWGRTLVQQMAATGLCVLNFPEYHFARPRRWRFDLAWPDRMWALEIEGAVWTQGRHTRGSGFIKDMEKYNEAAILGWRLLRVTPEQVKNGQALKLIERALS